MDPLAEVSRRWSTYNYVENNPIRLIDPDGMSDVGEDLNNDIYNAEQRSDNRAADQQLINIAAAAPSIGNVVGAAIAGATGSGQQGQGGKNAQNGQPKQQKETPLKGGPYNNMTYGSIKNDEGQHAGLEKKEYSNSEYIDYSQLDQKETGELAEWYKRIGEFGGGSTSLDWKTLKDLRNLKKLKVSPAAAIFTEIAIWGDLFDKREGQLIDVMKNYQAIHKNDPTAPPGVYEITVWSGAPVFGGVYSNSRVYYDKATKKYLGEVNDL